VSPRSTSSSLKQMGKVRTGPRTSAISQHKLKTSTKPSSSAAYFVFFPLKQHNLPPSASASRWDLLPRLRRSTSVNILTWPSNIYKKRQGRQTGVTREVGNKSRSKFGIWIKGALTEMRSSFPDMSRSTLLRDEFRFPSSPKPIQQLDHLNFFESLWIKHGNLETAEPSPRNYNKSVINVNQVILMPLSAQT